MQRLEIIVAPLRILGFISKLSLAMNSRVESSKISAEEPAGTLHIRDCAFFTQHSTSKVHHERRGTYNRRSVQGAYGPAALRPTTNVSTPMVMLPHQSNTFFHTGSMVIYNRNHAVADLGIRRSHIHKECCLFPNAIIHQTAAFVKDLSRHRQIKQLGGNSGLALNHVFH